MINRAARTAAAVCGGAALVVAVGLGVAGVRDPVGDAAGSSSRVLPAQPAPDAGAIRVRPVGGGGCIIGLNCGCIPRHTCPTPHARPGGAGANQHDTPAPLHP